MVLWDSGLSIEQRSIRLPLKKMTHWTFKLCKKQLFTFKALSACDKDVTLFFKNVALESVQTLRGEEAPLYIRSVAREQRHWPRLLSLQEACSSVSLGSRPPASALRSSPRNMAKATKRGSSASWRKATARPALSTSRGSSRWRRRQQRRMSTRLPAWPPNTLRSLGHAKRPGKTKASCSKWF